MYTKEFIETILKYSSDNQVSEKKLQNISNYLIKHYHIIKENMVLK